LLCIVCEKKLKEKKVEESRHAKFLVGLACPWLMKGGRFFSTSFTGVDLQDMKREIFDK